MQTTTAAVLITPAVYAARQAALDALTTPALRKARKGIAAEAARAERAQESGHGSGEDAYALQCLADWADTLLALRVNGYTGEYDS